MINFKLIYKTTGPLLTSISAHLCLEMFKNLAFSLALSPLPRSVLPANGHTHTHTLMSFASDIAAVALHRK